MSRLLKRLPSDRLCPGKRYPMRDFPDDGRPVIFYSLKQEGDRRYEGNDVAEFCEPDANGVYRTESGDDVFLRPLPPHEFSV